MNFTNVYCMSSECADKKVVMDGAGTSLGERVQYCKLRCPRCESSILIMPINKQFEYSITATTKEERIEERIKEATDRNEKRLREEIENIKAQSN